MPETAPSSTLGNRVGQLFATPSYRIPHGLAEQVADLVLRYPLDLKEGEHSVASIPDDLFDVLASVEVNAKFAVHLCEPQNQKDIETI
eukprot:6185802-Pleurochrysis_carterae.AAC.4